MRDRNASLYADRPLWGDWEPFHVLFFGAHTMGMLFALAILIASTAGSGHHAKRMRRW